MRNTNERFLSSQSWDNLLNGLVKIFLRNIPRLFCGVTSILLASNDQLSFCMSQTHLTLTFHPCHFLCEDKILCMVKPHLGLRKGEGTAYFGLDFHIRISDGKLITK